MFEHSATPRLFGLPPGVDFPRALVEGLIDRMKGQPPEALAEVELYVNTSRMQRRIREIFDQHGTRLLPRLRLVSDLGTDPLAGLPPAVSGLRRRLELAQLVAKLAEQDQGFSAGTGIYDLADSLADLMAEMQVEGVTPADLARIDCADFAEHWQRSLRFLSIVNSYFGQDSLDFPDAEARQRRVVEALAARWAATPPRHPVIVAGSTGSRGATAIFLQAVARLPQGAVVLPGFDFGCPNDVWVALDADRPAEDHPQYRFRNLMVATGMTPDQIERWSGATPPSPARNALISLALRPAPVTDRWMSEGPALGTIGAATADLTLIEAPSQRSEAMAIAMLLRHAAERGQTAALISPDRMLTRRVTAALDQWGIIPDDSGGQPLALSPPGRFLRHVADLFTGRLTAASLLTLLKHPLCNSVPGDRGPHLRFTREMEKWLRRKGPVFPEAADLIAWAQDSSATDDGRRQWAVWLANTVCDKVLAGKEPLSARVADHVALAESLAGGPSDLQSAPATTGGLWEKEAGRSARLACEALSRDAPFGGDYSATDYARLVARVLQDGSVRHAEAPHPGIMIWGTLEARVQGADLVVLGGLNEGVWPALPPPDPWLSRKMRMDAGLLLPERRIGLSAHDFQQAAGAARVVFSRSRRDAEAETVASRWLNRLTNLLGGLSATGGPEALAAMRARGDDLIDLATALERTPRVAPSPRPSPRPPEVSRPRELPVTAIKTLIRDPYAVYAQRILRLRPLDPVHKTPDARMRGSALHLIVERFTRSPLESDATAARDRLMAIADDVLMAEAPWPAAQRFWRAKLELAADWFIAGEFARRRAGDPVLIEKSGSVLLESLDFRLTARPDRIDALHNGRIVIYDYKTGTPPTASQQKSFDKQLILEAAMAERGGFAELGPREVAAITYVGLGRTPAEISVKLDDDLVGRTWEGLARLMSRYAKRGQGYTSRRAVMMDRFDGDFDHLARFGEWEMSDPAVPEDVG